MAKVNLDDYELVASNNISKDRKPINLNDYEDIEQLKPISRGITGTWEEPTFGEKLIETGKQIANVPGAIGRGLVSGAENLGSVSAQIDKYFKTGMAHLIPDVGPLGMLKQMYQGAAKFDVKAQNRLEKLAQKQVEAMQKSGKLEKGAFGIGEQLPNLGAALLTGPVAPVTFGVTSFGQSSREAEKEGANLPQQLTQGGIMGVVNGLTSIPALGQMAKVFTSPVKQALAHYLISIPEAGIQSAVASIANGLSKQFVYNPEQFMTNGRIDWEKVKQAGAEAGQAGITGAGTAAVLGAPGLIKSGLTRGGIEPKTDQAEPILTPEGDSILSQNKPVIGQYMTKEEAMKNITKVVKPKEITASPESKDALDNMTQRRHYRVIANDLVDMGILNEEGIPNAVDQFVKNGILELDTSEGKVQVQGDGTIVRENTGDTSPGGDVANRLREVPNGRGENYSQEDQFSGREKVTVEPPKNEAVFVSKDIPIDERNYENVSNKKVNAYQYDHPEVKEYIQAESIRLIGEMNDPTFFKGERFYTKGEDGIVNSGIKKNVSDTFQRIQDATKASYADIEKALKNIAKNEGLENYSLAKKIELIIDDNLTQGVKDIRGNMVPPDAEYIKAKSLSEGRDIAPNVESNNIRNLPQGENLPEEIQRNINYSQTEKTPSATNPKTRNRSISQEENTSQGMGKGIRVNADMGGYEITKPINTQPSAPVAVPAISEHSPIQLPELVELSKAINEGRAPKVKAKLGDALGRFNSGTRDIKLRADIFKDSATATRVLAHEIGHLADYLPDETMSRGNIIGRVATLKKFLKSTLDDVPPLEKKIITQELKGLSMRWKPFDPDADRKYTAYRNSSKELYADATSVLLNDPGLLKSEAPNFYQAFFNYLDRKPMVKKVYEDIQSRMTNPETVGQNRIEGVYQMLEEGNKTRAAAVKRGMPEPKRIKDTIEKLFIDQNQAYLKQIRQGKKQGGEQAELAQKAQFELEETRYLASEANEYINSLNQTVVKPLSDAELNVNDIGAYMLAKRAATERSTLANPRGLDEAAAIRMLKDLKTKLGDKKYTSLEKAVESYRKLREDAIIPQVEKSGMYSKELIDLMKESKHYARFNVLHYLEQKYGGQGTTRIYKQIGTLSDIENPFIATVTQDISMLRAAKMNQAKTAAVDFLDSIGSIETAEKIFDANVGGQIAKKPKDPNLKLFSILKDGKMESYYIDKEIAESFERNPFEATKLVEFAQTLTRPIKEVLVAKNPLWMARNIVRDVKATVKNVPEIQLRNIPKLAKYYKQAFGEVVRDVFKGNRSEDIKAMMKDYMINANRNYSGKDYTFENEIDRLVTEFQVNPIDAVKANGLRGKFKKAWKYLDRMGRVSELTGKVAGYKFLKSETNLSQAEIGHAVRTRIGTPDVRRQGALHQLTNNIFIFSNVGKEGIRTTVESFNANRRRFIWKTMMINVLPKLALVGAAAIGNEFLKETISKIPEYDKQMYDVIPLGLNKEGKAVYLRIPQDYEGQMWGALTWAISGGKFIGPRGILDVVGQQSPYNLNPVLKVAGDLYTYYVKGQNPTDDYRGTPVIPEKVFTAGGAKAHLAMLSSAWKNVGGSALYAPGDYSDKTTSAMEKLLKLPGLSVLGVFLKVSDKGELEQYYAEEDREAKENAQRLLKIEDWVIESVKSKKEFPRIADMIKTYNILKKEGLIKKGTTFPEFKPQYLRYALKVIPDSDLRLLVKATKAERLELLKKLRKEKGLGEYSRLIQSLRKMGITITAQ